MSDASSAFTPEQDARIRELAWMAFTELQTKPLPTTIGKIGSIAEPGSAFDLDLAFSAIDSRRAAEFRLECLRLALDPIHDGFEDKEFASATVITRATAYAAFVIGPERDA